MIEECEGYKKLLDAVESDEKKAPGFHDYRAKLAWIIERAMHYSEVLNVPAEDILNAWERDRTYWYMNYYQDSKQPLLNENVRVFETINDFRKSLDGKSFRCPHCKGVSTNPYTCNSGLPMDKDGTICNWKSYGFLKYNNMAHVFVKEKLRAENFFMPIAWEKK